MKLTCTFIFSVLIGAPKYQSTLYGKSAQKTGALFHCQWNDNQKERDVICNETDISKGFVIDN